MWHLEQLQMALEYVSPSHCLWILDLVVEQVDGQLLRLLKSTWTWMTERVDEIDHLQSDTQHLRMGLARRHLEGSLQECLYPIRAGWWMVVV